MLVGRSPEIMKVTVDPNKHLIQVAGVGAAGWRTPHRTCGTARGCSFASRKHPLFGQDSDAASLHFGNAMTMLDASATSRWYHQEV
jgi:hypothetical protein